MPDIPGFRDADRDRGDPRSGPLKGIRALDFGVAAAGPFALAWMATLGADVIKIERPTGDHIRHMPPLKHEVSTTFLICSVGKRGVALDLKNEAQREQVLALIRSADVALDNFRGPEVMERLGFGYEAMRAVNPGIVYIQTGAWGRSRTFKGMWSNEWQAQASSGLAGLTGEAGGRAEICKSMALLDYSTSLVSLQAILIALQERGRTGLGTKIEMSQYSASISVGYTKHVEAFAGTVAPRRYGSGQANIVPDRAFNTSTSPIAISAPTDSIWKRLCSAVAIEHMADLPMTARSAQRDAIDAELAAVFATRPASEWKIVLTHARVPHAVVATEGTTGEILRRDPQVEAEKLIRTLPTTRGDLQVSSPPWTFSRTPAGIGFRPPELGEHQQEVLGELAS